MPTLRLVPVSGPPIELAKEQISVGRDPSCDVVVTDGSVSRRHARIELRGESWWVVDQGSANGTYVNSLRVAEQVLEDGQEVRFGALAYRVDIVDPEATVATPILDDSSAATMLASPAPPPMPTVPPAAAPSRPASPPPLPVVPPVPPPRAAAPPPMPPPAPGRPQYGASPVPQMPAGAPPARKGRSPLVWVGVGCCSCVLLVGLFVGVLAGGAYWATKGAADAAHAWIANVREGRTEEATSGLSNAYQSRLSAEEFEAIASRIRGSSDATFASRSIDNDRARLGGYLTSPGGQQPIMIELVKEDGAWKVDSLSFGAS